MLLVYTPKITPRIHYTFRLFFKYIWGIDGCVTDNKEDFCKANCFKLSYADAPINCEPFIQPSGLLTEKGIKSCTPTIGTWEGVPTLFPTDNPTSWLPFDIFSAAFYLVSRYEEYKENQYLPDYKIAADSVGNTLIENSNLIRRKWLDNDYWGINNSVRYIKNKHQIWLGLNYYLYQGKHYGEVIWSQYANNSSIRHPYYADSATKKESNNYVKYMYSINDKVVVYTDLQLRGVNYSFLGYDAQNLSSYQKVNYLFFNPKLALTYAINATHSLQLQTGIANREPIRQDLINSTPTSRPKAEKLYDLELGYSLHWRKKLVLHTTFYSMDYKDQLVLTGQINDVGAYTRTNVKNSHRRGIEIDAKYSISNKWQLASTVSLSSNKIQKFREYVDDYDLGTQKINDYTTTNIAFSPSIISYLGITYQPMVNFSIQLQNRYVGKQYLDNTNNVNRMLASYYTADLHVHYDVAISKKYPIQLRASILNITNAKYANNGYTFSYILGQKQTTQNYYYPQATTSFLVGINVLLN